jgi:glucose-6-phosphate 1-dehydrogenase
MKEVKILLFGATGDLAKAKILPAFSAIGINPWLYGRKEMDLPQYIKGELSEISEKLKGADITHAYVSLPPMYIEQVISELARLPHIPRIALEKPFGISYADAQKLTQLIQSLHIENNIYLVDHYLGKPALVDLLDLHTDDRKKLYAEEIISGVEINALETNTVATRGVFYDSVGTIKDFVQSHILAVISTLLMQQGCEISSTECRRKVLEKVHYENNSLVIGQYQGFRETAGVRPDSNTETYISFNFKYNSLFNIKVRVGKAMSESKTEAIITYRNGTERKINIQSPVNSYEAILKDFMSDKNHFSLSYEEALLCWKITEDILVAKENMSPILYPQGAIPDRIS